MIVVGDIDELVGFLGVVVVFCDDEGGVLLWVVGGGEVFGYIEDVVVILCV